MKIIVHEDNTGFAPKDSRFIAIDHDTYGPGSPIGSGATPEAALRDLQEQLRASRATEANQ
jgi:hypothetical protein